MGDPEIVATNHGYTCRYTPTIMSGPVFRWAYPDARRFEVSASRDGVMVHGPGPLMGQAAIGAFVSVLRLAELVSRLLASGFEPAQVKQIITTASTEE